MDYELDSLIRQLTEARRDQVAARQQIRQGQEEAEAARTRATAVERAITTHIDQLSSPRDGGA